MTVFVYVNTSKQVGDKEHIKVFANQDAAEKWFDEANLTVFKARLCRVEISVMPAGPLG
ncbi:hypothetical protein ACFFWD_07045 [Bradyrhizobium erythrophlei]|uniref:hypothetical protein n=1 Tax=Bradyrhizobium erythrophlei TaxID=1437360 RepID=UPI0035E63406